MKKIIQRTVGMKKEIGRALLVAIQLITITFIGLVALFAGGSHQSTNARGGSQATKNAVAADQNVSSSASRLLSHQRASGSSFNLIEGPGPNGETITTDKPDYAPGETVVISGTGWTANEAVALHIDDSNGVSRWDASVIADASGNISNSDFVIQASDVGLAFTLTATQGTVTAWTQFTDVVGAGVACNGDPGGFEIEGDLRASVSPSPTPCGGGTIITDWLNALSGPNISSGILNDNGTVKNSTVTYGGKDPANCGNVCDDAFSPTSGSINDDPNTSWRWETGAANDKTDMNNVYLHISLDSNGHRWVTGSADRFKTNGTAYVDFEFLQNTLTRTTGVGCTKPPCGGFTSAGPDGGRTVGDILVSANYGQGGTVATVLVYRWEAVTGGFEYVDITSTITAGTAFVATSLTSNPPGTAVPYGAFGATVYEPNQFVELSLDLTALLGAGPDPCTGIQIKTVMIKTKTSTATNATLQDLFPPIQVSFNAGFVVSATGQNAGCNGGLGTVTGTFSGGIGPFECKLDNGSFASCTSPVVYNNVAAGSHTVTVKDDGNPGCQITSDPVTITTPDALNASSSPSPILCHGGSSTVTVSATGGTSPYSGTGTFSRSAGTYSFTVTDANSCTATTSGTITEPTAVTASSTNTAILCHGGNATVTVTANGGTAPYTGTGTFSHAAGSYSYTVTDANSCTATTTGTITEPTAVVAGSSHTAILCHGGSSTVTVSATGGTEPYSGTGTFAHPAGTYSYTVTDANSCTSTTTGTISEPDSLVAGSSNTAILCHGGSSTVTVSATGGTAPYSGTGTFSHNAGTYSYTVTDANSCTSTTTGTITEPDSLVAGSSNTAILCHGGSSTVTVSATGGTAPYSGTGTFAHNAGTYSYTVTDANSCTSTTTGTITEPDAVVASSSNTAILCNGGSSIVTVSATGGTEPYSGTGTFEHAAGTYSYTVTDANSCTSTTTGTITEPDAVVASSSNTAILCHGGSSTVTVSATGGTAPYAGTGTFAHAAGTYSYTVTDANSCTSTTTGTITEPDAVVASSSNTAILCNGGSSIVTVSATGGTEPYSGTGTFAHGAGTYSYTVTDANSCTSTTTGTITEPSAVQASSSNTAILCNGGSSIVTVSATGGTAPYSGTGTFAHGAGSYSYTVTDANSCTATTTGFITQPNVLSASSSNTPILCNGGTSRVTVSASGGTAPYSGTGTFTRSAGTYSYTVTDSNGCLATTTGDITQPDPLSASSSNTAILCNGGSSIVTVSATGGTAPYSGTGTFSRSAGTYSYTVTDANSCTATTTGNITQPAVVTLSLQVGPCSDTGNGSITATFGGGTGPYQINIDGGAYAPATSPYTFTGLASGSHTVTVQDANGCTKSSSIVVPSCPHCALTQGFYGNKGGRYTYNGHKYSTTQLLSLLTDAAHGGPLVVGVPGGVARSLTITQTAVTCLDGDNSCHLARLPANTAPATLPAGFGDQILNACGPTLACQTNPPLPLQGNGQWQNNLLGQTVTLTLNLRIDPTLGDLVLPSCLAIRKSVMSALNDSTCNGGFGPTVRGLLNLANRALAGQSTCSASLSDINDAIDSINRQFDSSGNSNCRSCQ